MTEGRKKNRLGLRDETRELEASKQFVKHEDKESTFKKSGKAHNRKSLKGQNLSINKADEIVTGSQFCATREDELDHSTIMFTSSNQKTKYGELTYTVDSKLVKLSPVRSFDDMDLVDFLCNKLKTRYSEGPTAIQALAISSIMDSKRDFVIRSPTGSGKTASFLVPIINQIQMEKATLADSSDNKASTKENKVYAIIMCPVRDLAVQLTKEARDLAEGTDVKVAFVVGECSISESLSFIRNIGCDIVVGTLGRISNFVFNESSNLNIDSLMYFVADEADCLERQEAFVDFFKKIKKRASESQVILSSATIGFKSNLELRDPIHIYVKDDMPPPTLVHGFINLAQIPKSITDKPNLPQLPSPKFNYLMTFFKQHVLKTDDKGYKRVPKTIVYVNGKRKVDAIAIALLREGFLVYSFHGTKTMLQRSSTIEKMKNGEIDAIIATNVLARGLNLTIDYVINYDLPTKCTNYVEFVHRVGRTARVGNYGIALTMFDPRIDYGFAPYLKKMLEYYGLPVPDFIGKSVSTYMNSCTLLADQYVEEERKRCMKKDVSRPIITNNVLSHDFNLSFV